MSKNELFELEHDAIVSLCQLDFNSIGIPANSIGVNNIVCFHGYNTDEVVSFNGSVYAAESIELKGFKRTSKGLATPTVTINNQLGRSSNAIDLYSGLEGVKFIRIKTMKKYLGLPFNPNYVLGNPDIYYVDRVSEENAMFVKFDLRSIFEIHGLKLPKQIITRDYCTAVFKSAECGYTGSNSTCNRKVSSCVANFGANNPINFNGSPGVDYVG